MEPPRYTRVILGASGRLRLHRLCSWHGLEIVCARCGNTGIVRCETLRRFYPRHMLIADMEHRFRCIRCGARGALVWQIVELERRRTRL